jgi:hypothetical protein
VAVQYNVKVRNRSGIRQYEITDFLSLNYSKVVNDVGLLNVELSGSHAAIAALEKDGQIEVWREDTANGIDAYCDFFGLYRARDRRTPRENKNGIFTLKAVSQLHFLKRAILAFPAGTNLKNDFTSDPAETVMKNMVRYNATSDATTGNGRTRTVGTWATHVTYGADTAAGSDITKAFAHRNLLEALQEVSVLGGLDFDLVKTGAQAWEFRTYALLGDDLTDDVKFSVEWDNLEEPSLIGNDIDEATVAIVGGEGIAGARDFDVFTGPNYVAGYNDIEVFVNAAQQGATSLEAAGNARLNELRARDDFRFGVLQNGPFRYGRDYCIEGGMGDLVSVLYYEATAVKKIRGAHISVTPTSGSEKNERVSLDMVTAL